MTKPHIICCDQSGSDFCRYLEGRLDEINEQFAADRAILLRGCSKIGLDEFQQCVSLTSNGELLEYVDRSTPRTTRRSGLYSSTVYPSGERIHLHNEGTYWERWAKKLYFFCVQGALKGGETPIADVRKVFQRIDPQIRNRFAEKEMMLVRNFNDGFGLQWQEVFQTENPAEVEQYCQSHNIQWEWKSAGRLKTRQRRPAIRCHPETGEPLWFNHAAFFHISSLEEDVRCVLTEQFLEDDLPYNTYYGDGMRINEDVIRNIRAAYDAEKLMFPWQNGDILILDNMAFAHGREPYSGDRDVVVCMTDPVGESECCYRP